MNPDFEKPLEMPVQTEPGVVPTLNGMGWAQTHHDPYSAEFLQYLPQAQGKVLEIGAAYGGVALEALKLQREILLNDLDPRHLDILWRRIPVEHRKFATLLPGFFPRDIALEKESLGAVLASRVLHFMDGPTLDEALCAIYSGLRPCGRLFIVVVTPFTSRFYPDLYPLFQERVKRGNEWPGYFDDLKNTVSAEHKLHVAERIHFFTAETLIPLLERHGFQIEKSGYIARTDFPVAYQLDGREDFGVIATKPAKSAL